MQKENGVTSGRRRIELDSIDDGQARRGRFERHSEVVNDLGRGVGVGGKRDRGGAQRRDHSHFVPVPAPFDSTTPSSSKIRDTPSTSDITHSM